MHLAFEIVEHQICKNVKDDTNEVCCDDDLQCNSEYFEGALKVEDLHQLNLVFVAFILIGF